MCNGWVFRNWVKGYESVLDPINELSVQFPKTFDGKKVKSTNPTYKETLLYLLLSQTSCVPYWRENLLDRLSKRHLSSRTRPIKIFLRKNSHH